MAHGNPPEAGEGDGKSSEPMLLPEAILQVDDGLLRKEFHDFLMDQGNAVGKGLCC